MKGAIMFSGGGSGKLFAAIGVTYPAGSTLTCTNGTKTLTAKTTSGQWVFAIPETGTWTVTATDGINTKSQSVSITKEGQFESVELSYQLILIAPTTAAIATGYNLENKSVTTNPTYGNYIQFGAGSTAGVGGYINPTIDLTNYNTLRLKACLTGTASSGTSYGTIGVYKTLPTYSAPNPVAGIYMGYGYDDDNINSEVEEYREKLSILLLEIII